MQMFALVQMCTLVQIAHSCRCVAARMKDILFYFSTLYLLATVQRNYQSGLPVGRRKGLLGIKLPRPSLGGSGGQRKEQNDRKASRFYMTFIRGHSGYTESTQAVGIELEVGALPQSR